MQSCDVDGNEWMDAFDAWRGEVVRALLAHFFVQPPAGFSAGEGGGWMGGCGRGDSWVEEGALKKGIVQLCAGCEVVSATLAGSRQ